MAVEICPVNHCDNYHFYINVSGKNVDGLYDCKKCGATGNLHKLMEECGDRTPGASSFKEMSSREQKTDPLPDHVICHAALLNDADALSYLEDVRGYTLDVIKDRKLGVRTASMDYARRIFKAYGPVPVLVIPYFNNGNLVFAKYRTLPPTEKDFDAPYGYPVPLYNEQVLQPGMEEVVLVEGEADVLALLSQGVTNVCGVPGANTKKAAWITKLDKCAPKQIYLLYDSDTVGQKAAYEMATRIGLDKVLKITLPEGVKDINAFFQGGGTIEEFELLKKQATKFDVAGCVGLDEALEQIEREIDAKDGKLIAEFMTPWPSVNKRFGGADRGDIVMVIAEEKRGKTTFALNWLEFLTTLDKQVMMYCLEMPAHRMARKLVSMLTETDDSPAATDEEAIARGKAMKEAIPIAKNIMLSRGGDMLFGYTNQVKTEDVVFETLYNAKRRYGTDVFVFDNLQLLSDLTLKNQSFRTTHISQLSKKFKQMAMELNMLGIPIIQPNRVRDGQIVDANNADGSSQLQKDCDTMIALHRAMKANITAADFAAMGCMDEELSFEPQTLVKVSRSRYAPGGATTLWFEGNISKFREFADYEKAEAAKNAPKVTNGEIQVEGS